jgi:hypothetical protein
MDALRSRSRALLCARNNCERTSSDAAAPVARPACSPRRPRPAPVIRDEPARTLRRLHRRARNTLVEPLADCRSNGRWCETSDEAVGRRRLFVARAQRGCARTSRSYERTSEDSRSSTCAWRLEQGWPQAIEPRRRAGLRSPLAVRARRPPWRRMRSPRRAGAPRRSAALCAGLRSSASRTGATNLLDDEQRRPWLRQLGVFVGGFSLDLLPRSGAERSQTGSTWRTRALLVSAKRGPSATRASRMLGDPDEKKSCAEYATRALGRRVGERRTRCATVTRARFVALGYEAAEPHLRGPRSRPAGLARTWHAERGNLRAAHRSAAITRSGETPSRGLRMAAARCGATGSLRGHCARRAGSASA